MPTRSFDVVILGGGNAGMGVTVATREAGLEVVMLEPDLLGGTCPNRGAAMGFDIFRGLPGDPGPRPVDPAGR